MSSDVASRREVQVRSRVTMGGAARNMTSAVPNGRVRMTSGGMIATRRTDLCDDREPRSPTVTELPVPPSIT